MGISDIALRVGAGFLVARFITPVFDAGGSAPGFVATLLFVCGLTALLFDKYDLFLPTWLPNYWGNRKQ